MKKPKVVKMRRASPNIYRITRGDNYGSPSFAQSWLVQAMSMTEALVKAAKRIKGLESEKLTIDPLGALTIK